MWRYWLAFSILVGLFGAVVLRLFYWQVIAAESFRASEFQSYDTERRIPARRGDIVDRDGSPFVLTKPAYLMYGLPEEIENIHTFVREVTSLLPIDPLWLTQELMVPGRKWLQLAKKLDQETVHTFTELKLAGLGFEEESKRYYPESSMAAHLLGFVGQDENGNDTGYFGLEGFYERELRGKDGRVRSEFDVLGIPILSGDELRIQPEHGTTLSLWIDKTVQYKVETYLSEALVRYGAKSGSIVVMDPLTGGILAMASLPSYDPQQFSSYSESLFRNPVVAETYEPGSTFKTLIMAAGLEEGKITPSTVMEETGPVVIGSYSIRTWDNTYHGKITMTDVLRYSSNVGMVYVANTLTKQKMLPYIRAFGFGEKTGIDLEDEESSYLRPDGEWRDIDLATASFGQGISVTPIQMVRAVGALANDGWLMEPRVVKEIKTASGEVRQIRPKRVRRVVSQETSHAITEMMTAAVSAGEAKWAIPKGYTIAGKTGTAQIPISGHYDESKTIASFVGFAPVGNPRFVMLVTLREPTSSPWGSETAAPLFFAIAKELFLYWGIGPDR